MTTKPAPSTTSRPVGIWIRVSTEDQARGESPAHHLERARAYATAKGWTVKEVYNLAGVSGKSVKDNPEARRMLADVKRGHITALIFSKLARLARNTRELLDFADHFRDSQADMVSLQETIDTTTPAGRLFFTMIAAMAQWEREEIADRQKASIIIRAKLGKAINGSAPYGYHWKDRRLLPNPAEVPIRQKIYEMFLQYRRKGRVGKLLNAAGYRTREGAMWTPTQIQRALTDSSARGVYVFNRIRKRGPWKGTEKPEEEWGRTECEPIVPAEIWEQANQILEEQGKRWKRMGRVPKHTFGNLTWCHCGKKMYMRSQGCPKYICRNCGNKIPIDDLDAIFREELHAYFGQPEQMAEHFTKAKQNLAEKESALAAHEREIQKVRDEMNQTHKLYLEGQVTVQGFGQFYKPAEERLNQLMSALPKLQAEVDNLKMNDLSAEEVLAEAQTLYDRWPTLSNEDKHQIAEAIIEKVEIGVGEVNLTLSYLPTSEELCKCVQQARAV